MPLILSRQDRRLLLILGAIFGATILIAILLSPSSNKQAKTATTYSTASEGTKAAYLLLRESGYECDRWERPPNELKSANTTLFITDPNIPPGSEEQQAIRKFVSDGGKLVIAGMWSSLFLAEKEPNTEPFGVVGWQTFEAIAPSAEARRAPEIKMQAASYWYQVPVGIPLYGNLERYAVLQYAIGRGQVIWLASSSVLSNAGLRESANLAFLLAVVGGRNRSVLWDEYFHGHRARTDEGIAHPQMKWLFVQLAILAAAVLATYSRRSGPQRAPVAQSRLSPLEFVQALGNLYSGAGAANVAVDICYGRFRYWAIKRFGLAGNASPEELAKAVEQRGQITDSSLLDVLKTCESAKFSPDLPRREALALVKSLYEYSNKLNLFPRTRSGER